MTVSSDNWPIDPFKNTVKATFADPAYRAALQRFHRINPRTDRCDECGEPFSYMPSRSNPRRMYCSSLCRRRAANDYKGNAA